MPDASTVTVRVVVAVWLALSVIRRPTVCEPGVEKVVVAEATAPVFVS